MAGLDVLKICSKFIEEYPCRSVISINLQSNFIEITLWHGCSPINLLHISRTPFLKNISGRLLLKVDSINFWKHTVHHQKHCIDDEQCAFNFVFLSLVYACFYLFKLFFVCLFVSLSFCLFLHLQIIATPWEWKTRSNLNVSALKQVLFDVLSHDWTTKPCFMAPHWSFYLLAKKRTLLWSNILIDGDYQGEIPIKN